MALCCFLSWSYSVSATLSGKTTTVILKHSKFFIWYISAECIIYKSMIWLCAHVSYQFTFSVAQSRIQS